MGNAALVLSFRIIIIYNQPLDVYREPSTQQRKPVSKLKHFFKGKWGLALFVWHLFVNRTAAS